MMTPEGEYRRKISQNKPTKLKFHIESKRKLPMVVENWPPALRKSCLTCNETRRGL